MNITNKKELPEVLINIVKDTLYKSTYKSYGVTTLVNKDNCEIILYRRHWEELEEDVADNVWALYGSAFHEYIKAHDKTEYSEYKLEHKVGNSKIVGVIDLLDQKDNTIKDYKTCSVYKIKKQDYEDWRNQLLAYCWLLRECEGITCLKAQIIAILKDYSQAEAKRDPQYPKLPIEQIDFTFTEEELDNIGNKLIQKVIELDTKYKFTNDNDLPPCSEENRWHSADTWRVFKKGNIRPTKVVWREEEAQAELEAQKQTHPKEEYYIEYTKGIDKKCEDYCKVKDYCPLYKATHK